MKIAIVDDSRSMTAVLGAMVRLIPDAEPVLFEDSATALDWCIANDPDLILVDYDMPTPDGLEFIETFRASPSRQDTPIVMITVSEDRAVRYRALQLGASDFVGKPLDRHEFLTRVGNLLKLRQSHRALADRASWLAAEVHRATRQLRERERETILFLSRAAEHRDPETANHLIRMAAYSRIVAEALGLPRDDVELIHAAAPMHDIGKLGIPDSVLLKPGRLSPDEYEVMKQHTVYGHEILSGSSSPMLVLAAEIAHCHHERYDGGGYPRGLAGEEIPLVARIITLADVFDALTSERPYKEAWSPEVARSYLVDNAGLQFDPNCVDAFLRRWPEILAIARRYREEGIGPDPFGEPGFANPPSGSPPPVARVP